VDLHEAALGLALVEAGVVPEESALVDVVDCRRRIGMARAGLPDTYEVVYRRGITPADQFVMAPGHRNFEPVERGQVIARDAGGDVRIPLDGLLFLPLYQRQGDDGFFVIRPAAGDDGAVPAPSVTSCGG
jgi:succinylglutamate desuccinylase